MAATYATSRLAARLEHLPHAALVELCALACTLDAHESRTAADAALARDDPLPTWAVDEVLLSSDLAPRVVEKLEVKDGAAAAVCRAWRVAWGATRKQRRWLHSAQLATPDFQTGRIRALPTGSERKSRLAPTRLKEHRSRAPSIAIRRPSGLR